MTKKQARKILNNYVKGQTFTQLPIKDFNLGHIETMVNGNLSIETYSFKGLLKIAYDL